MPVTATWRGGTEAISQESSYLFGGTWLVGETITVTVGFKAYTFTTTTTAITTILDGLVAALNGLSSSVYPELREMTWSKDATHLYATMGSSLAGVPFTATLATNSGSGTIGAAVSVTANSGPNCFDAAANWSTGLVPVTGDTVIFDDPTWACLYGLNQAGVITLAALNFFPRWIGDTITSGTVGLPLINQSGTQYPEYRTRALSLGATLCNINCGSGRIILDFGSVANSTQVLASGTSPDGLSAVMLKGTSASNVLRASGASDVGVAILGGETANLSGGIVLGPGAVVRCGSGVTIATVVNNGGGIEINGAVGTSIVNNAGTVVILGTGAIAQLTATNGSSTIYSSSGTLGGNTTLDNNSTLDFSGDQRTKAVTNAITARSGSRVLDPNKVVTSLVVTSTDGTASISWGAPFTLTRS
jgi:hypothetical protein